MMPSFELAQKIRGNRKLGQVRKEQSDAIMESTWDGDISSRTAWIYDMYHDPNPKKLRNLDPEHDYGKIPLDIKFVKHTSQSLEKDAVSYHLLMKPSQECNVPYYQDYVEMYDMEWPLGLTLAPVGGNAYLQRGLLSEEVRQRIIPRIRSELTL